MRLTGKLTTEETNDVRRLIRSKWHWPRMLVSNLYGIVLLGFLLWFTVSGLLGYEHPNWPAVGCLWLFLVVLSGWFYYRIKRNSAKELTQLNNTLPDWVDIDEGGVRCSGPNGATSFHPWSNFKDWREGKQTMLLYTQGGAPVILSIADLPEIERQSLRRLLNAHLALGMTKEF